MCFVKLASSKSLILYISRNSYWVGWQKRGGSGKACLVSKLGRPVMLANRMLLMEGWLLAELSFLHFDTDSSCSMVPNFYNPIIRRALYYHMADKRPSAHERILKDVMESIAAKFLLNLPKEEKNEKVRLAYHYQKAYYYYIDEALKEHFPRLDPKKVQSAWVYDRLNEIVRPYMKPLSSEEVMKMMGRSKPTCGAIIINEKQTKVLVVEAGKRLGFPKGGKNENQTAEDCAARETKEEVGLFIHDKINPNDKIEFLSMGDVPATYFIVRNFDQNEEIKIDRNEIDSAFWMQVSEVSRQIMRFTNKSRLAWKQCENQIILPPSLSMHDFLATYGEPTHQKRVPANNPLLNFQFDRERLAAVLQAPF